VVAGPQSGSKPDMSIFSHVFVSHFFLYCLFGSFVPFCFISFCFLMSSLIPPREAASMYYFVTVWLAVHFLCSTSLLNHSCPRPVCLRRGGDGGVETGYLSVIYVIRGTNCTLYCTIENNVHQLLAGYIPQSNL
jgi:hypothetical protein